MDEEHVEAEWVSHPPPMPAGVQAMNDVPDIDRRNMKSRLTEEKAAKFIQLMQMGNYAETAAAACGIAPTTIARIMGTGFTIEAYVEEAYGEDYNPEDVVENPWPEKITNHSWRCRYLASRILVAEGEAEAYAVGIIRQAAQKGDWRAAATFLERRHSSRWRRKSSVDLAEIDRAQDEGDVLGVEASRHVTEALRAARQLGAGDPAGEG